MVRVMPADNRPSPSPAPRKFSTLTWIAGAFIILALLASTVLSVVPGSASSGAGPAPVSSPAAEPTILAPVRATLPATPPAAQTDPELVLGFTSCDQVWAGGQGPFREGQNGYTKELDPDGDGIACESSPKE